MVPAIFQLTVKFVVCVNGMKSKNIVFYRFFKNYSVFFHLSSSEKNVYVPRKIDNKTTTYKFKMKIKFHVIGHFRILVLDYQVLIVL